MEACMLETATKTTDNRATTTADDTLKRNTRDADVISGGHLVAKALKNEGVDTIFTLCGGHIIDIYDGCIDEGIRIIDVRHEQVAAHAADGYARQTGKLGCVVTTAGPGCTNAVTGIATAFRSESPVLHIGGQGALTQHKMGSLQDLPHVDLMTPITKFAATVPSTERVADMISMAAREAFNGAPGPVYLEIPRDVLDREVEISKAIVPKPGHYRASTRSLGDPGVILGAVLQAASGRLKQDKRQARRQWMKKLTEAEAAATEKLMPLFKSNNTPIHPYRVAYELNEFLADNTIYIGDGGDVVTISAQAVRPRRPGQWMDPGALGSLGVGTGFAIAAGLAQPRKEVLCYYGDGSFGMTAFDMETANRFGVPYIAVIGHNSAMTQIRYGQLAKYGEERGNVGNLLGDVPFGTFAQMLGGYGEEVRDPAQT